MKQSSVDAVIRGLKKAGVSVVCYLPDSLFKELYPALDADPDIRTIRVTNEGEGAAICGGVFLSGKRAALVMENSGLRASVEPLARMGLGAGIPVVMLMSYRGELGENNWWAIPHGITMEPNGTHSIILMVWGKLWRPRWLIISTRRPRGQPLTGWSRI